MNIVIEQNAREILDIVRARQDYIKSLDQGIEDAKVALTPSIKDAMALVKTISKAERDKEHISDKITTAQTQMTQDEFKAFFGTQEKEIERLVNLQNDTTDELNIVRKKIKDDRQTIKDKRKARDDHKVSVKEEIKDDSLLLTLSKQLVNLFKEVDHHPV